MKKLFPLVCILTMLMAVCGCKSVCQNKSTPQVQLKCQKNIFLPRVIYAVPGIECNIYFKNIFLAVNHANYIFDVECQYGAQRLKRWTYTPEIQDGGKSFPLTIKVYDEDENTVACASTTVIVTPADAGKDKNISILMIGDSLTDATAYPNRLCKLCKTPGNPRLTTIGAHAGRGRKAQPGEVCHEGYGGWTWKAFYTQYKDEKDMIPRKKIAAKSKFLTLRDGKKVFDFANYLKQYNQGKTPDYITIMLGINDLTGANRKNLDSRISQILKNADTLIGLIRKDAPDVTIGVGFITQGADQNAFGVNHKSKLNAWTYYRNSFRLNQAMAKHFAGKKNICMIPVNVNLDTENNFPEKEIQINGNLKVKRQSNAVHPSYWGYNQIGDTFYAWLKYQLSQSK